MTIKEAVEIYNKSTEEIERVHSLMVGILSSNSGYMKHPSGCFLVSKSDMDEIGEYLGKYCDYLKARLNQTFE